MAEDRRVLISGGSIAGPTLAYWLGRHGFRVTVVEKADGPRAGGSPIDVRGPAAAIAARMGITAQLAEADIDTIGLAFVDARDRQRSTLALRAIRRATRAEAYELDRQELGRILRAAGEGEVEYVFGDSITALHEDASGVDVEFAVGSARRFELVVGADGVHSNVRRLAYGEETPFVQFRGYYAAVVEVDPSLGRERWGVTYNVPGRMVTIYSPPGRCGALFLFSAARPQAYDRHDPESQKALVNKAFSGLGWKVPTLLEALAADPDPYFDAIAEVRLPRWSRGRVALVGDAACGLPLFGDGSSVAISTGYALAEALAAHDDHRSAFDAYETETRPRIESVHKGLRSGTAVLIPRTAAGIWARNQLARLSALAPAIGWLRPWDRGIIGARPERQQAP